MGLPSQPRSYLLYHAVAAALGLNPPFTIYSWLVYRL